MSTASQSTGSPIDLERAEQLKRELIDFATSGPLKQEYSRQQKLFFELSEQADEHEIESVLDWFLFDWFDEQGEGVIEHFLAQREDLSSDDQEMVFDWADSLNSVFEIRSLGKNSLELRELDSGNSFTVITSTSLDRTPLKRGQYIAARLLPFGEQFVLSGLQFIMPSREAAMEWLEMRRALDTISSPEALENAQREQCSAFCELFGCDELTVGSNELNSILQRFQNYLFAERRDPQTGMTSAEKFQSEFGRELIIPEMPPLPEPLTGAGEVTILCDDFDGIVFLPDFNKFKLVFESDDIDTSVPDWQEIIWKYIKDPDIPIVAFERVAEVAPARIETVLRKLLSDNDFSIEHLYAVLLHYKQPVEGLEELEDDERLWDLLNGNTKSNGASAAPEAKTKTQKSTASKRAAPAAKKRVASSKSGSAKKSAASKSAPKKTGLKKTGLKKSASKAKITAGSKAKPAAKGRAKAASASKSKPQARGKAKQAATTKASKRASAKKR
jgi:hypothetical protein